jgi:hypothetical protein
MHPGGYDLSSGILTDASRRVFLDTSVKMSEDKSYPPGYICYAFY